MPKGDARYDLDIVQVDTFDGNTYEGNEALEHLNEADQVFYRISYGAGEEFYRWVGGPYEDLDSLEAVIEEETSHYEELTG